MSDGFGHSPTPPPVPAALPVMDYDTPPPNRSPWRVFVIAAVIGLGLAVLAVLVLYGLRGVSTPRVRIAPAPAPVVVATPQSPAQAQAQVQQWLTSTNQGRLDELLVDSLGPATVVYEEDPVQARKLHGNGVCNAQASRSGMSQPFFSAFEPPTYRTTGFRQQGPPPDGEDALLFAHRLTSKSGNVRLVLLTMDVKLDPKVKPGNECDVAIKRKLEYRVCQPKLFTTEPEVVRYGESLTIIQDGDRNVIPIRWIDGSLRSNRNPAYNLRFFAGQADPKDLSHFRLDYEFNSVKQSIDGYLTDDDFLRIIPRGGKVDQGGWLIDQP